MVRTQTDVDYVGDRVVVEPIDVPLGTTYEQLLEMIYSVTDINKEHFRLILSYLGWMKLSYLLNKSEEDEEDEEGTQCDDDSVGAEDVHNDDNQDRRGSSPFLAVREAIEREQMRYVVVDGEGCNLSNNPDTEDLDDPIELSPMQYHLAPSPQFENVENIGHVVSSEWTPWGNTLMGHPTGEFIVGQIFNSKGDLQHAVKIAALETKVEKFNMHMETIGRINQDALSWLEVIPFEKWALSHDGGRRYGIMTTNMSEVFNSVLKGARSFPITAFVQLTFYRVNSYFAVRREHGASRLASGEQYTPYVDAKINANVVKAGSHEVVLYDHFQGLFHVKASRGSKKTSSGGRTHRVNLHSMKRVSGGRPKSTCLHNEMDVREGIDMSTTFMDIHARVADGPSYSAICDAIRGSSISARWLREQFSYPPVGVDDVILQRYARAFILALLGGALFANKTGIHVQLCYLPLLRDFTEISHYSWGSAVLAYLYRELCHLWSWERLHVGRPDFGRPPVPIVVPHVLWEPYTADLIAHLPAICQADEEIWRTMSPLICFDIIEWHIPERVLRQFRMQQGIPLPCLIDMELHLVDRRGRHQYDWVTFHAQYISLWATRSERIATAPLAITTMSFYDPYMQWYRRITRRLIAPVLHRDHMRVPPIRGRGRGGRRAGHRHVPLASTLVQPSHPPVTSTFPLFQPSASLESPLSPPDVSIPAYSPRPETTIPSTLTPVQPSISLDAPPPIAESIASPPVIESIAPPPITESIAPLPFLQGTAHAARLHVRVPRGHRAPRVRRVLPPSVPSISTAHVDDVSQSIEMETFQIAQMDTTNMAIYRRCSQRKRKIPSCGTH
ncbi:Serine/threonine-protein phosphatase 7 long form-like [Vitis vinifera]|uniref:Serine/threonine-protein phosphatase 7 long form-like n=1 Tax=Vitis vinifera TaxID=29760 RepID=A0A438D039_VITVI|nr:Serine/threonine-protein phosphatase 7 long form-like [Vitis vinifera]